MIESQVSVSYFLTAKYRILGGGDNIRYFPSFRRGLQKWTDILAGIYAGKKAFRPVER